MAKQPTALDITRDTVRIDTMNPPGRERECAEYLGKILEDGGLEVDYHEFADGRTSLVARIRGSGDKPAICFGGHIDTVPLGAAPWTQDPFAGDIGDGKIYGRGTTDMKAGVAAYVQAALRLAKLPRGEADVVLVVCAGEETGCEGSFYLAEIQALGDAGAIVIAEPTSNYPILGHKGALWLEVEHKGVTAHGSMPHLGVNALYKAARAVTKLEDFDFNVAPNALLGPSTLNVGTMHSGMNLNSVPDQALFTVDIRSVPGHDHKDILSGLDSYLGEEAEVRRIVDVGGVLTDSDDPWIQEIYELMTPILGEKPEPRGAPYFTDASALTPAYGTPPTIIMGPGQMDMAHKTDEYCVVDKIDQAAQVYETLAQRWCGL